MATSEKIGIIGSGLIGRSWAMIFAGAGYEVSLYDIAESQVKAALKDILTQLKNFEKKDFLRGNLSAEAQYNKIRGVTTIKECVENSIHVQECIPERLEMKIKMFKEIDAFAGPNTVMSSSTSCIVPSKFTSDLKHKENCIVCHPVNPPYYVPLVEIIPAPWTSKQVVARTRALMEKVGQAPVTLSKEMQGFALNRIQYAILNECLHLINDGILSVKDVDTVMTEGLAMRYAFLGPMETIHLNAEGTKDYFEKYGQSINTVSKTFKPVPSWKVEDSKQLIEQLDEKYPLDKLQDRRYVRDEKVSALARLKNEQRKKGME